MRSARLLISFVVALACGAAHGLVSAQAASAEPDEPPAELQATYRDVVVHAIAEFDAKRFAEARSLFLRAHELWPSARTLRTLGMTAFELRMYPNALEELQGALDDPRRALPDEERAQVSALVERTREFVGRYRVRLTPPDAELLVDGAPRPASDAPLVLAVGEHSLLARAKGYSELRRTLVVQGREDAELAFDLQPIASSAPIATAPAAAPPVSPDVDRAVAASQSSGPNRAASITAFSAGAAGLIAGSVFIALAADDKSELDGKCPMRECPPAYHAQRAEMERFANFATVGFVIGVAGAALGTYLWLDAEPEGESRIRVNASGLAGRF